MVALASGSYLSLPERIDQLNVAAMREIVGKLELRPSGNSREQLARALAAAIGSPVHHAVLEAQFAPDDWAFLRILPLRQGAVRQRSLVATLMRRGLDAKPAAAALAKLIAYGCLLPTVPLAGGLKMSTNPDQGYGERNYWLGLTPHVGDWALEYQMVAPEGARVDPPATRRGPALHELQRALSLVVSEAGRKPIKLTIAGAPYKPEIARLAKALGATGSSAAQRAEAARETLALLWFALSTAVDVGLLQERAGTLVRGTTANDLLGTPLEQLTATLLEAWTTGRLNDFAHVPTLVATYGGHYHDAWLSRPQEGYYALGLTREQAAAARTFVRTVLTELMGTGPDAWYGLEALARVVGEQQADLLFPDSGHSYSYYSYPYSYGRTQSTAHLPYPGGFTVRSAEAGAAGPPRTLYRDTDWMEVEGAFVRHLVTGPWRWLGLVEVDDPGRPAQPTCFHLTDLGQHLLLGAPLVPTSETVVGRVIVQPNFEVVVTDAVSDWRLLAQLDTFAERQTLDRAATYRLTQAALVQGLDRGWTGARVLATLEAATGAPLPQNVRYTLQEWAGRYESLSVRETATLLEADSPSQLDGWIADPVLAAYLGRRLGPTAVLVPARHLAAVDIHFQHTGTAVRTVDYAAPPQQVLTICAPDLIEMAIAHADPYLHYWLSALADPTTTEGDRLRYRITAGSVARAGESGWSGPQLIALLAAAAREPLPVDVRARLLGWSGSIPPLSVEPLVAVELRDSPLAWAELQQIEAIAPLLRALPLPTLALVGSGDLERLRTELAARGITLQEHPVTAERPRVDRMTALREALQAFDTPRPVLREMVNQGLLSSGAQSRYY